MPRQRIDDLSVERLSVATRLVLRGVDVVTAVLLASGQAVDLNGEAGGLILDAAAVVVLQGATAGHGKLVVSGTTILDATSTGLAVTGTETVSGLLTASAGLVVTGTESVSGALTASAGVRDKGFVAVTASGAIAVPAVDTTYFITKSASGAAMTLVDPTATTHDNLCLLFISTTAQAHSLDNSAGSGFFSSGGGSKDVGTFGGAIGDGFCIRAYQGKWYIDPRGVTNVTLG